MALRYRFSTNRAATTLHRSCSSRKEKRGKSRLGLHKSGTLRSALSGFRIHAWLLRKAVRSRR